MYGARKVLKQPIHTPPAIYVVAKPNVCSRRFKAVSKCFGGAEVIPKRLSPCVRRPFFKINLASNVKQFIPLNNS